jgi:hypothetical protein
MLGFTSCIDLRFVFKEQIHHGPRLESAKRIGDKPVHGPKLESARRIGDKPVQGGFANRLSMRIYDRFVRKYL